MSCSVVAQNQERWFGHNDFETAIEHDIDCRVGGCWPSQTVHFHYETNLSKREVMRKTHEWVSQDPKNIICEITCWGHGYTFKVWKADEKANMLFVRGQGDHALVYSTERCIFRQKINNALW